MRFVIIASPRTGSSHLVNMLGAHPEILCNGNIYHPKEVWVFWPEAELSRQVKIELRELRRVDPAALLERVYTTNFGRSHVGFKIFEGQNDEILNTLIENKTVKKIVLYRKNVLANYSSKLVARKTNKFNAKEGEVTKHPPVKFSRGEFIDFQNKYNAFYRRIIDSLNEKREPFHFMNYDEINDPALYSTLLNFIGASPFKEATTLERRNKHVKQNSSDIVSRFSNPKIVLRFLEENGLLHWTQEGETSLDDLRPDPPAADFMPSLQDADHAESS